MDRVIKQLIIFVMILVMGCTYAFGDERRQQAPDSAYGYQPSAGLKVADALCVRIPMVPLSIASTAVFTVISPFVYMMGIGSPMFKAMVEAPWRFTADRPLGDFTGKTKDGMKIYEHTEW